MKRKLTISSYMWRYFAVFSIIILVLLWTFQIAMFKTYYQTMKSKEILEIAKSISKNFEEFDEEFYSKQNYEDFNINDSEYFFSVGKIAFESGVSLSIFDDNGDLIQFEKEKNHSGRKPGDGELLEIKEKITTENINNTFTLKDSNYRTRVVCAITSALLKNGDRIYFYIKMPIMPLGSTVKVLQTQLFIVTIISLIIALIAAYFVSKSLAKPIKKMTNSAKILAKGNYDVHFEGTKYYEIKELSDSLNYAAKELSKTDTLRRDLLANVSHDLKTPLTIIKSYAEMIRDLSGDNPQKRNEHTQVIIDETDRLTNLVSDILDLSKIESGTVVMQNKTFDLSEVTETIIDVFKILQDKEGYIFKTELDKNSFVYADEKSISQVIYNLINNAINYTGSDNTIIIKVKNLCDNVRFEVTDTGEGIEESEICKVWDRYYKSSKTHKRTANGTGIGLSIVKNILEEYDANYGIDSKQNIGSTFWFELSRKEL